MYKDYFLILGLKPDASIQEIKKAYRKHALLSHPDTTQNNIEKTLAFEEIKEAYEVLTHPEKRHIFLQEKWYRQSQGITDAFIQITPGDVLQHILKLYRTVRNSDINRIDYNSIEQHLLVVFTEEHIQKLNKYNDPTALKEIQHILLQIMKLLPLKNFSALTNTLLSLNSGETHIHHQVKKIMHVKKNNVLIEKYKFLAILVIVLLLCGIIYLAAGRN